ncbi:hypothetical protein DNTS_025195 [Danionella cerebrum]|uniref:Enoyl-CoA hydratase domain-containing protein 3, mitochondrial n=1 Tax=Danionella cerebrum TaxID=2873325 RepID=A0A553QIF2_9TELE|nr:hypothetical protein DNTS_025195 [Danionella translucida]
MCVSAAIGPVFSSGHDLKELTSAQGRDFHNKVFQTCSELMLLIQDLPVPVMAMVNGAAAAAGCQLVASCDIAVASESSRFAAPGVNVGLFCSTPGVAIGRAVPRKAALELLLTGRWFSSEEALRLGLLSAVVPAERLEEEVLGIAHRLCQSSRSVLALGKAEFHKQMGLSTSEAYSSATTAMLENLTLRDGQEGIRAFLEKRRPMWSNSEQREENKSG